MVWHEDATGAAAIELAPEFGREGLDSIAKEEIRAIFVPSFRVSLCQEFLRCISTINIGVPLRMEHLTDHSGSTASVEDPGVLW